MCARPHRATAASKTSLSAAIALLPKQARTSPAKQFIPASMDACLSPAMKSSTQRDNGISNNFRPRHEEMTQCDPNCAPTRRFERACKSDRPSKQRIWRLKTRPPKRCCSVEIGTHLKTASISALNIEMWQSNFSANAHSVRKTASKMSHDNFRLSLCKHSYANA